MAKRFTRGDVLHLQGTVVTTRVPMTKSITAHIDEDLYDRLERFRDAQLLEPSKSEVIRAALAAYLDDHFDESSETA